MTATAAPRRRSDYVIGQVNAAVYWTRWRWTYGVRNMPPGSTGSSIDTDGTPVRIYQMPSGPDVVVPMEPVPGPLHFSRPPDDEQFAFLEVYSRCLTNGLYVLIQTQVHLGLYSPTPRWHPLVLTELRSALNRSADQLRAGPREIIRDAALDLDKAVGAGVMTPLAMRAALLFLLLRRDPEIVPPLLAADDGTGTPLIELVNYLDVEVPNNSIMPLLGETLVPPRLTQARSCQAFSAMRVSELFREWSAS